MKSISYKANKVLILDFQVELIFNKVVIIREKYYGTNHYNSPAKGGTGYYHAHIAVSFAQTGRRIAIIDIDPQGSLSRWHAFYEKKKFGILYLSLFCCQFGMAD